MSKSIDKGKLLEWLRLKDTGINLEYAYRKALDQVINEILEGTFDLKGSERE